MNDPREVFIWEVCQYRAEQEIGARQAALSRVIAIFDAQAATIADLRAALTEAHQHAEVLQTKLDEVTKESEG